ncbi:MAG: hypothetical protein COA84_14075 [Robiginitomaculum sp.]|nr:MAG: hypothetical protein COA84_14075 [Robiginitomaculum sp.]
MQSMWDAVGSSYKSKTNRSLLDIRYSLRLANNVIYKRALLRAPSIRSEIRATEPAYRKAISLKDKSGLREASAMSRRLQSKGIVARRIVGSAGYASQYIAAVEYGRDEFVQPRTKIVNGAIEATFRKIGRAKAQPFLRQALFHGAQPAYDVFASTLEKRWAATMRRATKGSR